MAKEPWYSIVNEKQAIYFPTLKFQNEKYVNLKHKFSSRKDESYYWMVYPHHLEFRMNTKIAIYCSFDFSTFPFDSHECDLLYGMNFFSWLYARMVPATVVHKKKQTKLAESPLIGTNYQMNISKAPECADLTSFTCRQTNKTVLLQ